MTYWVLLTNQALLINVLCIPQLSPPFLERALECFWRRPAVNTMLFLACCGRHTPDVCGILSPGLFSFPCGLSFPTNQSWLFYFPNQTLPNNFERPDIVFEACFSLKVKSHLNSFYLPREGVKLIWTQNERQNLDSCSYTSAWVYSRSCIKETSSFISYLFKIIIAYKRNIIFN